MVLVAAASAVAFGVLLWIARPRPSAPVAHLEEGMALMLALRGMEQAIEELGRAAPRRPWSGGQESWTFHGEDANGNGLLEPEEDSNGNGRLDVIDCPVDRALRPSFAATGPDGGVLLSEDSPRHGTSFEQADKGRYSSLKVTESASKIYVNDSNPDLARMLNNLAKILGLSGTEGDEIVSRRPDGSGYRMEEDLEDVLADRGSFRRLRDFVTTHAWVDPMVIRPLGLEGRWGKPALRSPEGEGESQPGDPSGSLRGNSSPASGALGPGELLYGYDELHPRAIELAPRAPININTAPEEVLTAVLVGLEGFTVSSSVRAAEDWQGDPSLAPPAPAGWGLGYEWMRQRVSYRSGTAGAIGRIVRTEPITERKAREIARRILSHRLGALFREWSDFEAFLAGLVREGVLGPLEAAVLAANANPNTDLNDFNPDRALLRPVDKTDLLVSSTEFCFGSMGYFLVEALSVVPKRDGSFARRRMKRHIRCFDVYRETAQSQFLREFAETGRLDQTVSTADAPYETSHGVTLQFLPEPLLGEFVRTADYDGQITLGTVESSDREAPALRASFSRKGLEADGAVYPAPVPDRDGPRVGRLVAPSPGPDPPGDLYPDGVFLERDASLLYNALGHIRPTTGTRQTRQGVVSLWIKPRYDPLQTHKIHTIWSLDRKHGTDSWINPTPFGAYVFPSVTGIPSDGPYAYGSTLEGRIGWGMGYKGSFWVLQGPRPEVYWVATGHLTGRDDFEKFRQGEWTHFVFRWDLDAADADGAFQLTVNGKRCAATNHIQQGDPALQFPIQGHIDFAVHGEGSGPNTLKFGGWASSEALNTVGEATYDEILVFQGKDVDGALLQWEEGRYYRETDATFTSGPIDANAPREGRFGASGLRVSSIAWTVYRPESLSRARIEARLYCGNQWLGPFWDARGSEILGADGRWPVAEAGLRYRLRIDPATDSTVPLLETPVIDDVLLVFATAPETLAWLSRAD